MRRPISAKSPISGVASSSVKSSACKRIDKRANFLQGGKVEVVGQGQFEGEPRIDPHILDEVAGRCVHRRCF
jgi:hypothetical protein